MNCRFCTPEGLNGVANFNPFELTNWFGGTHAQPAAAEASRPRASRRNAQERRPRRERKPERYSLTLGGGRVGGWMGGWVETSYKALQDLGQMSLNIANRFVRVVSNLMNLRNLTATFVPIRQILGELLQILGELLQILSK